MRITSHLLIRAALIICIVAGGFKANAQQDPRQLDPSDVFFQAWLTIRDAEKFEEQKKFDDAWKKYSQAAKYYDTLARFHKDWKPHLVKDRIDSTRKAIANIEPKAAAELVKKNQKTRDLVEGGKGPGNARGNARGNQRLPSRAPMRPTVSRADQQKLDQLIRENQQLRANLAKERKNGRNGPTQQKLLEQIAKKDRELATMRDMLARAPLQADMDRISRESKTREREIEITARALKENRKKLNDTQQQSLKFQQETKLAQARAAAIQKQMEQERGENNKTIRTLREELKTLSGILEKNRQELGAANARITQYQRSLSQAQSTIKELTQERDDLRRERDTLVGILKQGDAKGVQKLISENMRLGRELKQSMDRLKLLEKDNGAAKDELIEARRDLAVAKSRILKYQQAQASHNVQIKTLERQLRDAEADLAAGGKQATPANQEEAKTLRSTIKRLLAAQSRRRTAEKLLWETYKKSGTKIPGMEKAYADVRNVEVELTAKEDEMLAARRPDGEFRNPNRVPLAHARAHGDALEQEVADHHKLVVRFFERGHFELARGVLLDSDERLPGYFPTLCNLGVVEVNTQNYLQAIDRFSEAITMKDTSSYAHYMLGYTHYLNHDWDASRNAFEQALRLNPENARTQFYLGNLAGAGKRYEQAEKHFNAAIQLDPTMADAYFNISVLYLQQKRKKEALEAYRKALDNGSKPDPKHEQLLAALR